MSSYPIELPHVRRTYKNYPPSFEGILPRRISDLYEISEERALVRKERIEALVDGSAKTYPALELFDGPLCTVVSSVKTSEKEPETICRNICWSQAPFIYGVHLPMKGLRPIAWILTVKLKPAGKALRHILEEDYDPGSRRWGSYRTVFLSLNRSFQKPFIGRMTRIKSWRIVGDPEDSLDDFKKSTWGHGDSYDEGRNRS